MSYAKYPKEMKEAVIARMLQGDETVTDIQRDTGIGINTLYRWRDKALNQNGLSATTKYKNADKWSSQDKFTVVIETANLSEYVPNFQPQGFTSLTEARLWVKRFVEWYNNEHRHSGIHYVTPAQRHNGEDKEILAKRKRYIIRRKKNIRNDGRKEPEIGVFLRRRG